MAHEKIQAAIRATKERLARQPKVDQERVEPLAGDIYVFNLGPDLDDVGVEWLVVRIQDGSVLLCPVDDYPQLGTPDVKIDVERILHVKPAGSHPPSASDSFGWRLFRNRHSSQSDRCSPIWLGVASKNSRIGKRYTLTRSTKSGSATWQEHEPILKRDGHHNQGDSYLSPFLSRRMNQCRSAPSK